MIETLETRNFLSIAVENGVLTVRGTQHSEAITLAWKKLDSTTWNVEISDGTKTQLWGWSGHNSWNSVSVYGGNGEDRIEATFSLANYSNTTTPPVPMLLNGGAGNDTVIGSDNADTLLGGSGYDSLVGLDGADSILGEAGKDTIVCGAGNDTADGGIGRDKILGDAGNDVITGGAGNDQLDGGVGDDLVSGNGGVDAVFAGSAASGPFFRGANIDTGHDTLFGSEMGDANDAGMRRSCKSVGSIESFRAGLSLVVDASPRIRR